jgi:putative ABC transport system permease protein
MAQEYWPNEDPVGRRVRESTNPDNPWMTVVGVAGDVRQRGLHAAPRPKLYRPLLQAPRHTVSVAIKTDGDAGATMTAARAALMGLAPHVPVLTASFLEQLISDSVTLPRVQTFLMTLLAGLGGLLAVVGIYGVLACATAQRMGEIGLRMALGARAADVVKTVIRSGVALSITGLVLGLGVTLVASRVLESYLYQTSTRDPATVVVVALVLFATALLPSFIPAWRATKVDLVDALRRE